jgi:formylglycine-generating enzyme required for sulfatase activity
MKKSVLVFIISVLFISCWNNGRFKRNSTGWLYDENKWGGFEEIKLPKFLKKNWILISGGALDFPRIKGTDSVNFNTSPYVRKFTCPSFYAYNKEVTNKEYREFVNATKNFNMKPDTLVWIHDSKYTYTESMTRLYFWHPKYDDYPVVGVSQIQAKAYCEWLQNKLNEEFRKSKKYRNRFCKVRLPSDLEWSRMFYMTYLYKGPSKSENIKPNLWNYRKKDFEEKNKINFGKEILVEGMITKYNNDWDEEECTAKYNRYKPAKNGIYNLAGNVAEWTISPAYNHTDSSKMFIITMPNTTRKYVVRYGKYDSYLLNRNDEKHGTLIEKNDTLKDYLFDSRYDFKPIYKKDGYMSVKGGTWYHSYFYLQPGVSIYCQPHERHSYIGFRPIIQMYDTVNGRKAAIK